MKIEHVAIWVKDIDNVCEFYRKYFGGVVQPLYHNPTKQFTSRFVTFEDGARLEIMHRPDIDSNDVGTSTDSNVWTVTKLQSNTHRSANEKMQAFFRFLTSAVFHVKPLQGECSDHTCMGIAEPKEVGHEVSKQLQTEEAAGNSFTDISEVQQVGSEGANTIAKPDTQHLGFTHLSFSVGSKEEVDRLTQQMSFEGIPVVGQPRTTGDGYYESVVLDPEGNRIEITV
jgi:lactoylglutathione lyase